MLIWASQYGSRISRLMVTILKNEALNGISSVLNSFEKKCRRLFWESNKDLEPQLQALLCADLCPPCVSYSRTRGSVPVLSGYCTSAPRVAFHARFPWCNSSRRNFRAGLEENTGALEQRVCPRAVCCTFGPQSLKSIMCRAPASPCCGSSARETGHGMNSLNLFGWISLLPTGTSGLISLH